MRRLFFFGALAAAAWAIVSRVVSGGPRERRAEPDPEALMSTEGDFARVGVNLEKLRDLDGAPYRPLVQYLTAIQIQRGENESLLFVRRRDLDALAALAGEDEDNFIQHFRQLGVLISPN